MSSPRGRRPGRPSWLPGRGTARAETLEAALSGDASPRDGVQGDAAAGDASAGDGARLAEALRRGETDALVAVAQRLDAVPGPLPEPDFRAALGRRVRGVASVQGVGEPLRERGARARAGAGSTRRRFEPEGRSPAWRRWPAVVGGAGALTAAAAVAAVVGVTSSLPGDALYPARTTYESLQRSTAEPGADRALTTLLQATRRLEEADELTREGAAPSRVAPVLDRLTSQTQEGSEEMLAAAGDASPARAQELLTLWQDWAAGQEEGVADLRSEAPPALSDDVAEAAEQLDTLSAAVAELT